MPGGEAGPFADIPPQRLLRQGKFHPGIARVPNPVGSAAPAGTAVASHPAPYTRRVAVYRVEGPKNRFGRSGAGLPRFFPACAMLGVACETPRPSKPS